MLLRSAGTFKEEQAYYLPPLNCLEITGVRLKFTKKRYNAR